MNVNIISIFALTLFLSSCATVDRQPQKYVADAHKYAQVDAQKMSNTPVLPTLKRKVAIGRFSNETRYGRSLLVDENNDPLGKQVSDILASRLVESGKFLVFERPDIDKLKVESSIGGIDLDIVGVDTMILGSLTQFGNSVSGKTGFLSSTKKQQAEAAVELRLVDVTTGHVFFNAQGSGIASTESGEVAGFGSRATYDGSLNDKAINAAISDLIDELVNKLEEKEWRSYFLSLQPNEIYISGGNKQGLKSGMKLSVIQKGKSVRNPQTGFMIELPGKKVGDIKVVSTFGTDLTNEGSICNVISGDFLNIDASKLYVTE